MRIIINGRPCNIDRMDIEKKTSSAVPKNGRRFFITINGRAYPVKQVFSIATGLPAVAFSTSQAFNVLSRLGFEISDAEAQ